MSSKTAVSKGNKKQKLIELEKKKNSLKIQRKKSYQAYSSLSHQVKDLIIEIKSIKSKADDGVKKKRAS